MPAATNPQSLPFRAHGVANWVDLHTAQMDEARIFYEALLGWTFRNRFTLSAVPDFESQPGDQLGVASNPAITTVVAHCNDRPVADLVERGQPFDDMALLSSWFPYVYVEDLDRALELVRPAGGLVLNPPADRGTTARVAMILDPSDAVLCLWAPTDHGGAVTAPRPGTLAWIELETVDLDSAKKFYGELFGWDAGEVAMGDEFNEGGTYTIFTRNGERVAGAVETAVTGIPASWCPSFAVADVDTAVRVAARNGAVLMAEPIDIPVGRQAMLVDPTGAAFSVLGPRSNRPRPL